MRVATQGPSKPLRPGMRGQSPRGKPPHQGRWPRSRPEGFSPLMGSIAKPRAGHARPLRTAVNGLRTRGAREGDSPSPSKLVGGCPGTGGDARPVGTLQASQARPAPLKGEPFARAKPAREASPSGEVAAEQAGRVQPVDGQHSKVAGRACPAPTDCCFRQRGFGGTPEFKVKEGSAALRTDSNTASV